MKTTEIATVYDRPQRLLTSQKSNTCFRCKKELDIESEQELGYCAGCLQILPEEQERLKSLRRILIELVVKNSDPSWVDASFNLLLFDTGNGFVTGMYFWYLDDNPMNYFAIPDVRPIFPKLKKLSIVGDQTRDPLYVDLPGFIKEQDQLEELEFKGSSELGLASAEIIQHLTRLKKLNLSDNRFSYSKIPEELFTNLTQLKELNLTENRLRELPESLGNLESLEMLDLSGNYFSSLPESLGQLKNLKYLGIDNFEQPDYALTLPESIGQLEKIEKLILPKITNLPESIGQLKNLKTLDIYESERLTQVPESIGELQSLEFLSFNKTGITAVPESLGKLQKLITLGLSDNQLTEVPESLGNLEQLENFSIKNNLLTVLPESFNLLKKLRILDLRNNNFNAIPPCVLELWNYGKLNELLLSGNNILLDQVEKYNIKNKSEIRVPIFRPKV